MASRKKITVSLEADEYLQAVKIERAISDALIGDRVAPVGHSELFRALLAELVDDDSLRSRVAARIEAGDMFRARGGAA